MEKDPNLNWAHLAFFLVVSVFAFIPMTHLFNDCNTEASLQSLRVLFYPYFFSRMLVKCIIHVSCN